MTNYYEQLNLAPQATAAEIESAIDALYNAWRQGATHPDATVVDQVNRNLRALQKMRATLGDPDRRAAYDASIGLHGTGGLSDPAAKAQAWAAARPSPPQAPPPLGQDANPWQCPRCQTITLPDSLHCQRCGTKLADPCPKCDRINLLSSHYCKQCGSDLVAVRAEHYQQLAQQREAQLHHEINALQAQIAVERGKIELNARLAKGWIPQLVLWWPFMFFWNNSKVDVEVDLVGAGGYSWLRELGVPFVLWVILTIVWSAAGGGILQGVVLVIGAATVLVMLVRFRKAKRNGVKKRNAEHQKRIDELEQQIRQLQES